MKKILLIAAAVAFSTVAKASFMAEPYLGYLSGTTDFTGTSGSVVSDTNAAVNLGARLGMKFNGPMFLAVNLSYLTGTAKNSVSYDLVTTNIFVDIGADFSSNWRLYAGYAPSSSTTLTGSGTTKLEFTGGSAIHAGIGTRVKSVNLAVEYLSQTFSDVAVNGGTAAAVSKTYPTISDANYLFIVGFPLGGK